MSGRGAVAFAAALIVFLACGLWLGGHPSSLPGFLRDAFVAEPGGLTAEAAQAIEDTYYEPVRSSELGNASLQGMVRRLREQHREDRYTEYLSPQGRESFNQQIEGRFSGIGLSVVEVKKGLRVAEVFSRSPADRAGIRPGETIVSVEGKSIAGLSSAEATDEIRGPEGTRVTIGLRGRGGKVRELTLTRTEVALPNVSGKVKTVDGRKLGYIRFLSFSEGAHALIAKAVRKLEKEGARGIVLDLRHNPGGLLDEAVLCASVFLPEGEVVVSTRSRTEGDSEHKTVGGNLPARPLVVLIDGGTASAAEILAAALADDSGAEVVGTRSYGKGLFQEERGLSNGGAIKLSVGAFYTPAGVNLAKSHGIHPDAKAADDPRTKADEAERRALAVLAGQIGG